MNDMTNWWGGGFPSPPGCAPCPPPFPPPCPPCPPMIPPGCPPWFSPPTPPWYPGANAGVSFGTTYPQNPCRGHFLWDGKTLWLFDGVSWQTIGPAGSTPGGVPEAPIDGKLYGRENAAWVEVPSPSSSSNMGVTNGSDAAPGQIGEIVTGTATASLTSPFSTGMQPTITPIPSLSAGDWNVDATCSIVSMPSDLGATPPGGLALTFTAAWAPGVQSLWSYWFWNAVGDSNNTMMTVPLIGRISSTVAAPVSVSLQVNVGGGCDTRTGAPIPLLVGARCRRMR